MQLTEFQGVASDGAFEVPDSTGYQTYAGLLSLLSEADEELIDELHSRTISSITNSGLLGTFDSKRADRPHHKMVLPRSQAKYRLRLGITDEAEQDIFQTLVQAVVIDNEPLPLAHGNIEITGLETEEATPEEVLEQAGELAGTVEGVAIDFERPACRERYDGIFESTPDRVALFSHLARRWNAMIEDETLELSPVESEVGGGIYTKIDTDSFETYSVVVGWADTADGDNEGTDEDSEAGAHPEAGESAAVNGGGNREPITVQGFQGTWKFHFSEASEATQTAVLALSRFAEFAGVGRHTARGCGTVSMSVIGGEWHE